MHIPWQSGVAYHNNSDILNSPANSRKLKIELAVTVYALCKGNLQPGPLSIMVYECVRSLYAHIGVRDCPNVNAVARQLAGGNEAHEQQLTTYYAARCVDPAFNTSVLNLIMILKQQCRPSK